MNIPHLIHPVLIERDDILQILYQAGDPVVMGEFVEHVRQVEGDGLDKKQIGNPLVVGVIDRFQLKKSIQVNPWHPPTSSLWGPTPGWGPLAPGKEKVSVM